MIFSVLFKRELSAGPGAAHAAAARPALGGKHQCNLMFAGMLAAAIMWISLPAHASISVTKSFSPASIVANGTSTITITLQNIPSPGNPSPISFTDNYPAGLTNAAVPTLSNSCGGSATATANGSSLSLTGGQLSGNNSCSISVTVTACTAQNYVNPPFTVSSGAPDATSNAATLTVVAGPTNAATSTVSASPVSVLADGTATSTITVTLRDICGNLLSGKTVSLAAGSGSSVISAPSGPSNASGVVSFKVRNSVAEGPITYASTSTTDAVAVTQTAAVTFTRITAPTVVKSFSPSLITPGGSSTLTITLSNPNTVGTIRGAAFTDAYPAGMVNAATPVLSNSCGGTATGAAGGNSLGLTGANIPASASCSVSIVVTASSAGTYNNSTGLITSANANNGLSASAALTVASTVSSFNAVQTGAHPTDGKIFTKVAGVNLVFDLIALDASNAIATGFTGTVSVAIVDNSAGGACTSLPLIATLSNQTFTVADQGRHPLSAGNVVANVWPNVRVRITFGSVVRCSQDSFAIRPASLTMNSVTDATPTTAGTTRSLNNLAFVAGNNVHHAGRPFTIRATAANAVGVTTTNYAGSPTAVVSDCNTAGPPAACTPPILSAVVATGAWSAASGVVTTSNATYTEVGSFGLQLEDQTFAAVDIGDGSTPAERNIPLSAKVDVGRFVPDSYVLSAVSMTNRTDILGCHVQTIGTVDALTTSLAVASAANITAGDAILVRGAGTAGADLVTTVAAIAGSTITLSTAATTSVTDSVVYKVAFTYHGEPMGIGYALTARNAISSGPLLNYKGLWARGAVSIQAENNNDGVSLGSRISGATGNWNDGVYVVNVTNSVFSRTVPPDGPFDRLQVGVAVTDLDGPALQARNMNPAASTDCVAAANCTGAAIGTIGMRFGRLKLSNAHGSELLNLPVPIGTEFWNGTFFVPNIQDNCTSIDVGRVTLGGYRGGINAGNMNGTNISIGGAFSSGKGSLVLTKPLPSPATKGSVDISINLVTENKTYLRTGPTFSSDPTARATFGINNGGPIIYLREMY